MTEQHQRQHSDADRQDFARIAHELCEGLRRQRSNSALIFHNGRRMIEVRDRGLWALTNAPGFEAWILVTHGIRKRQLRKYVRIGEKLSAEFCADLSLCIDALYQIAQAPESLWPTLRALGDEEELSPGALGAGWRAGFRVLSEPVKEGAQRRDRGDTEERARAATGRAALAWTKADEEEPKPGRYQGPVTLAALVSKTKHDLGRVLGILETSWPLPEEVPLEEVQSLLEMTELARPRLRQLFAGSGLVPVQAKRPVPVHTQPPVPVHTQPVDQATGRPDFGPLFAAMRQELGQDEQDLLEDILHKIARGDAPGPYLPALQRLYPALGDAADPVPRCLFDPWIDRLLDLDPDRRGSFALWSHERSRLPGFVARLRSLREAPLSAPMRGKVDQALSRTMPRAVAPSPPGSRSRLTLPLDLLASRGS